MGLLGTVLALSPRYLELEPGSILSDAVLSVSIAFLFWSFMGFVLELSELKRFISGFNSEGWENLTISLLVLTPAVTLYAGVQVFSLSGWLELTLKLMSIVFLLFGSIFVAVALDYFFVLPRLGRRNPRSSSNKVKTGPALGSLAIALTWLSTNVVNALIILDQLFR